MNIVYLLEHISEQLHTIVRHFGDNSKSFSTICKRIDLIDDFEDKEIILNNLLIKNSKPYIFLNDKKICYGIVYGEKERFLIGPIVLKENTKEQNLFLGELFVCDIEKLLSFLLLLHNMVNKIPVTKNEILDFNFPVENINNKIQEQFVSNLFQNLENSNKHNSHSKEMRELTSITNGDVNSLIKSWEEDLAGVHGRLAKDELRQEKNLAITTLILASRAAIDGGLHPEVSYTIVDSYIYELEELKEINKIVPLMRKAEIYYTELVRELKTPNKNNLKHPIVESAKDYIVRNVHSQLSIKIIADELSMNANYLAEIFKNQENISIPNYIVREKIKIAKNMLIYTKSPYIVIATDLGFSSQSYFTKKFREDTGITPKKFRDLYGIK